VEVIRVGGKSQRSLDFRRGGKGGRGERLDALQPVIGWVAGKRNHEAGRLESKADLGRRENDSEGKGKTAPYTAVDCSKKKGRD